MATAMVKETLEIPAERVWAKIADFGDVSWFPGVNAEVSGSGVGTVRLMKSPDGDIHEELTRLDADGRSLTYVIAKGVPFPVTGYTATMTVTEAGDAACELEWKCDFEPDGAPAAEASAAIEGMYQLMIGWLRDALK